MSLISNASHFTLRDGVCYNVHGNIVNHHVHNYFLSGEKRRIEEIEDTPVQDLTSTVAKRPRLLEENGVKVKFDLKSLTQYGPLMNMLQIIPDKHLKLLREIGRGQGYFLHTGQNRGHAVIVKVFNKGANARKDYCADNHILFRRVVHEFQTSECAIIKSVMVVAERALQVLISANRLTHDHPVEILSPQNSLEPNATRVPPRREYLWVPIDREQRSLDSVASAMDASGGTPHRCAGYVREEIMLAKTIARSAVVCLDAPTPREICAICNEVPPSPNFGAMSNRELEMSESEPTDTTARAPLTRSDLDALWSAVESGAEIVRYFLEEVGYSPDQLKEMEDSRLALARALQAHEDTLG
ncbi:hypothetical protein DFH07DRAFT_779871 [Mycena maculata]|uniref:Uncharacterized protein n=1 Tax=Mycena maculata TaxID=230809 RepID=A0AAD7I793_9AGAR|nr:hypothetical protein DFH07DRAFT_779871 [Mycena maculata]